MQLLVNLVMLREKNSLVRIEDRGILFNKCNLCIADNMDRLWKVLTLSKDHGLTSDSSGWVIETTIVLTIHALVVRITDKVIAPIVVATTISSINPKTEHLIIMATDLYICEPLAYPSHVKRNQGDNSSTHIKEGFLKQSHLVEDAKSEALTHFFRILSIIQSRVPSTPKEFNVVVSIRGLPFTRSLFVTDRRVLFANASRTLFKVSSSI